MKNTFQTGWIAAGLCLVTGVLTPAQAQRDSGRGEFGAGQAVTRQPNAGLEAQIETDRTQYSGDRAVEITLSLTNISRYDTQLMTPGRGPLYEVTVRDGRSGRTVYTLDNRRGTSGSQSFRLAKGDTRTWRELWDGRNDDGDRVPAGTYVVEARIARQQAVSTEIYIGRGTGGRPGRGDNGSNGNASGGGRPWGDQNEGGNGGRPGNGNGGNPERPDWSSRPPRGDRDNLPGGASGDYSDLRATLTSSRTVVRAGDSVRLTFTVQNGGQRPISLRFLSGQQWDVTATGPNGRRVWRESDDKFYTQAITGTTLNAGADRTFTTTWQLPTSLPSGRYELQASLTAGRGASGAVAPASLTLRVTGGNDQYGDRGNGSGNYGDENGNRPRGGYAGRDDNGRDSGGNDRYDNYGNRGGQGGYSNRENRTPSGVVLGSPTIVYGSRVGATLVSPRILLGRDGAQYLGKKVTVSGRFSGTTNVAGQAGWQLGGDGVILPIVGTAPNVRDGVLATTTGVVRQTASGQVYLSVP